MLIWRCYRIVDNISLYFDLQAPFWSDNVCLYVAGTMGLLCMKYLTRNGISVHGYIVSNRPKTQTMYDLPIIGLDDFIDNGKASVIITNVSKDEQTDIKQRLDARHIEDYVTLITWQENEVYN